jgi:nicotinate-nucleotide adenylyltransferase
LIRVAVLGGSFSPPHVGHALVAAWLAWTEHVDEVWLLPAASHPFGKPAAPWADRLAWCTALAETVGSFVRVCAVEAELRRGDGPVYTVDVLDHLASRHPGHAFRLVVGADVLPDTRRWHAWGRLAATYPPIVVGRSGFPPLDGVPTFPEVSSTEVRRRIATGESVEGLVPARVLAAMRATGFSWADPG